MRDKHLRGFHEETLKKTKLQGGQGCTQNHERNQHDTIFILLENEIFLVILTPDYH